MSLDPVEIVKRCRLPLLDVRRLVKHIIEALQVNVGIGDVQTTASDDLFAPEDHQKVDRPASAFKQVVKRWNAISTLDDDFDKALGGGIPTGYITEVTGERLVPLSHREQTEADDL